MLSPLLCALGLVYVLVEIVVIGFAMGAMVAVFTAVFRGERQPKVIWDIALGAFGSAAGFLICPIVPIPENTVYEHPSADLTLVATSNHYQHPYRVAFAVAALAPAAFEIWRAVRRNSKRSTAA